MSYAETRELVRLRYDLRRLLAERPPGADADARRLIARIEQLVAADTEESARARAHLRQGYGGQAISSARAPGAIRHCLEWRP